MTLVFTPGNNRECAIITPINDNVTKGREKFPVRLVPTPEDPGVNTGPSSIVILRDDDCEEHKTVSCVTKCIPFHDFHCSCGGWFQSNYVLDFRVGWHCQSHGNREEWNTSQTS